VKDKFLNLGKPNHSREDLWVDENMIGMKRGSNTVKLTSKSFDVNVGSKPITLTAGHLTVNSKRIDLG
jgi:hypothetical protein